MPAFSPSENTIKEFDRETDLQSVSKVIQSLVLALSEVGPEFKCYVLGGGKQPLSLLKSLQSINGARVVWRQSLIPPILAPLRIIVASYKYLVHIETPESLGPVFDLLISQSMATVYIFRTSFATAFEKAVTHGDARGFIDYGLKEDSCYFFYMVDADNLEVKTNVIELLSHGKDTPRPLRRAVQ